MHFSTHRSAHSAVQRAASAAFVTASILTLPAAAQTATLDIDAETAALVAPGGSATAHLVGPVFAPAVLAFDIDAGPVVAFGQSIDLGFTPVVTLLPVVVADATGTAAWPLAVPANPSFVGLTLYFAGAVVDATHPSGLRVTNGAALSIVDVPPLAGDQLAGRGVGGSVRFTNTEVFQTGSPIRVALDAHRHPYAAGKSADVYLVEAKGALDWALDPTLVDASSNGPEAFTFQTTPLLNNTVIVEPGALPGSSGPQLSVAYDVVVDVDRNGLLGAGDVIDGLGDADGVRIVPDLSQPGPYAVTEQLYSGPTQWLRQDIYYPSNVASLSSLPFVMVSHGNGHDYQWYDHLGEQLASWGFVVMSHRNNTGPGVQSAATTILDNLDHFLGNLPAIAPALVGKVDATRIGMIGHSRGGEGVVIAYHRLFTGVANPANYDISAIKIVSSIAPTYFEFSSGTPDVIHDVPFHTWVGGADADVTGCEADSPVALSMGHYGWAEGERSLINVQGAGHGAFHDGGGSTVATGPCLLTRADVHAIMRPHALALFSHYLKNDPAAEDFLEREWADLRPLGSPTTNCAVVHLAHTRTPVVPAFVVDDFQSQTSLLVASSLASVTSTLFDQAEGELVENDNFTADAAEPFNSATHGVPGDPPRGGVFSFNGASQSLEYELPLGTRDVSGFGELAFMLAQASRHPNTVALAANVRFAVRLEDENGASTTLRVDAYGDGIGQPYARGSCGTGTGWAAEFESFRLPLVDFTRNGSALDLTRIRYVELLFGSSHGTAQGRIVIDQIEFSPF